MDYEKEIPFGAFDSELMHEEISIPEGFEATIEGNKIILKKIESEDEKVRKTLIEYFKVYPKDYYCELKTSHILAWLEKQGEQNDFDVKDYNSIDPHFGKPIDKIEPTDNVEPKFNKGDWMVLYVTENIYQVVAVIDNYYQLKYGDNYTIQKCADVDRCARLWDITKDTKKGDVLSDGTTIFIFKDLLSDGSVMSYCDYDTYSGESDAFCPLSMNLMCSKITPATKEQRDLLFQKMKEAGYEWDAEKLKLKIVDWSKHIKYNPNAPSIIKEESAWNEEDDYNVQCMIAKAVNDIQNGNVGRNNELIDWLKSLKDRVQPQNHWKPTEEQIKALANALSLAKSCGEESAFDLRTLHEQLKKL